MQAKVNSFQGHVSCLPLAVHSRSKESRNPVVDW